MQREQASVVTTDLLEANTWRNQASTMNMLTTDPRGPKAVAIATEAGQWLKCRTADGRKAYGIRSSRDSNEVYFVTRTSCTCYDGQRHECKHQLAVQLHCELVAEQDAARFAPKPVTANSPELARILGKPRKGFEPIVRED
jgi:hypothetical protein